MAILVDTSVWIDLLRPDGERHLHAFHEAVSQHDVFLCRFVQLELLQGCRDAREWDLLDGYLACQDYLEAEPSTWRDAGRIQFELRRLGLTVRSPIDCCIAQMAIENDAMLLHRDRDFEVIGRVCPLKGRFLDWNSQEEMPCR